MNLYYIEISGKQRQPSYNAKNNNKKKNKKNGLRLSETHSQSL